MRDSIRNEIYFNRCIDESKIVSEKLVIMLKRIGDDQEKEKRIKNALAREKYNLIKAKYSRGDSIDEVYQLYKSFLGDMSFFWDERTSIFYMYDMMALTVLFDEGKDAINMLNNLVLGCKRNDGLTEFYTKYVNDNLVCMEGKISYGNPYERLKDIINSEDKVDKLKEYVKRFWYKEHRQAFWYNTHNLSTNCYYGYWSFESGAIAKILKFDDYELKDMKYYPYDLVHYKEERDGIIQ